MSEPFKPEEVLWRWVPTEKRKAENNSLFDEYAIVSTEKNRARATTWARHGDIWGHLYATPCVVAELLRQFREAKDTIHRLVRISRHLLADLKRLGGDAISVGVSDAEWMENQLEPMKTTDPQDVTNDVTWALTMMQEDWNARRDQGETGLDPDALSPEMQKIEELLEDFRAGRIQCRRGNR